MISSSSEPHGGKEGKQVKENRTPLHTVAPEIGGLERGESGQGRPDSGGHATPRVRETRDRLFITTEYSQSHLPIGRWTVAFFLLKAIHTGNSNVQRDYWVNDYAEIVKC